VRHIASADQGNSIRAKYRDALLIAFPWDAIDNPLTVVAQGAVGKKTLNDNDIEKEFRRSENKIRRLFLFSSPSDPDVVVIETLPEITTIRVNQTNSAKATLQFGVRSALREGGFDVVEVEFDANAGTFLVYPDTAAGKTARVALRDALTQRRWTVYPRDWEVKQKGLIGSLVWRRSKSEPSFSGAKGDLKDKQFSFTFDQRNSAGHTYFLGLQRRTVNLPTTSSAAFSES
jgi:hypothetical protein